MEPNSNLSIGNPESESFNNLDEVLKNVDKSFILKDVRYLKRAIRSLASIKKCLDIESLTHLIKKVYPVGLKQDAILKLLPSIPSKPKVSTEEDVEMEDASAESQLNNEKLFSNFTLSPEIDIFIHLLVLLILMNEKHSSAADCGNALLSKISAYNRRSLDILSAKCYFYFFRVYEILGKLDEIFSSLVTRLQNATLHKDWHSVATLQNLILRYYILKKEYARAEKFASKTNFPEEASSNECARYFYYLGFVKAIHLDYSEAHECVIQASRKGPHSSALGFRQAVAKLRVLLALLLGEIQPRSFFKQAHFRRCLLPYLRLTQAVLFGELSMFSETLEAFKDSFLSSGTYTLVLRLHSTVLKLCLRRISLAYSRISFADLALKLQLPPDSIRDIPHILAKAIRHRVIQATLSSSAVTFTDPLDVYSTFEPTNALVTRIRFCLNIHDNAIKAFRYPPKPHEKFYSSIDNQPEDIDADIAKKIAEFEEEDFY